MSKKFVRILNDVYCDWEGLSPTYRVYVNDELFSERKWNWSNSYLEEMLQVQGEPGEYHVRYELVSPHLATITVKNTRVNLGDAVITDSTKFRITP